MIEPILTLYPREGERIYLYNTDRGQRAEYWGQEGSARWYLGRWHSASDDGFSVGYQHMPKGFWLWNLGRAFKQIAAIAVCSSCGTTHLVHERIGIAAIADIPDLEWEAPISASV